MPASSPRYRYSDRPSGGSRRSARRHSPRATCATGSGAVSSLGGNRRFNRPASTAGLVSLLAFVEPAPDVLLGILLAELFLTFAEPALVALLGIFAGEVFLTLAEPTDLLVLWEGLRIGLTLGEVALE